MVDQEFLQRLRENIEEIDRLLDLLPEIVALADIESLIDEMRELIMEKETKIALQEIRDQEEREAIEIEI